MIYLQTEFNECIDHCDVYDIICHETCSGEYSFGLDTCPCRSLCPEGCHYGGCSIYECPPPQIKPKLLVLNTKSVQKAALFSWGERKLLSPLDEDESFNITRMTHIIFRRARNIRGIGELWIWRRNKYLSFLLGHVQRRNDHFWRKRRIFDTILSCQWR